VREVVGTHVNGKPGGVRGADRGKVGRCRRLVGEREASAFAIGADKGGKGGAVNLVSLAGEVASLRVTP
tara:strand:+ start:2041 stop:2247 length:207 start_codon:yes stop_codon:yes gene_type:complete